MKKYNNKKICVIGLGYIGLPTACIIANNGYKTIGVDINKKLVEKLKNLSIDIKENKLNELLKFVIEKQLLEVKNQIEESDIYIICVQTPFKENYEADLVYLEKAINEISKHLKKNDLIIIESTIPPNTTKKIAEQITKNINLKLGIDYYLAHCPERVLPGKILVESIENDRIIGTDDPKSADIAYNFYKSFIKGNIHLTNTLTAEMCKLCENTYRDINIAYANELSMICDDINIDIWELINLANKHPRVNIHNPGAGVGGHCIAVDPWFLISEYPSKSNLIRKAREINYDKENFVIKQIEEKTSIYNNPIIACMGASYKADIDDVRQSPSLRIIKKINEMDLGTILVSEPNIYKSKIDEFDNLDHNKAIEKAEIIVFFVKHSIFKEIDKLKLKNKLILDYCGILNAYDML